MKRNEHLQILSREHHHGLLLGWKIRQGIRHGADVQIIAEYIAWFSSRALFPHFEKEENEVLVFLPDTDVQKQRALKEHQEIRATIGAIAAEVNAEKLLELTSLLDVHIRFEERELFPYMERILSAFDLERIGAALALRHEQFIEHNDHEFWKPGD